MKWKSSNFAHIIFLKHYIAKKNFGYTTFYKYSAFSGHPQYV